MPRSKTGVKRKQPSEEDLTAAVQAVLKDGMKVHAAGKEFNVARTTLQRHIDRHQKSGDENFKFVNRCAVWNVFSSEEESSLVQYLVTASHMHYGLSRHEVRSLSFEFAKSNNKKYPSSWDVKGQAGERWYSEFMKRHAETISLQKPQATSLARATSFNRANVKAFFSLYTEALEKHKFGPENVWNVDESGISTVHTPGRVVASKGVKQVGSVTSGERGRNITIIGCVNAVGNAIPPMMIFPRLHFKSHMLKGAPPGTLGAAHPSGWSNGELFVDFLKHFILHAKPSLEKRVLLILDNHDSHITIEAINLAKESGIVMLTFPPHTSHKLQPLDRGVFGPLKKYYNSACSDHMLCNPGKPITIYDVAEIIGKAYPKAFIPNNILSGFRVSGIWPMNQDIFRDDEFLSAHVTDRPQPEDLSVDTPAVTIIQPTTSGSGTPKSCGSVSSIAKSPEEIRPYPKAQPRKSNRGGRKPGKTRILTDTPEKTEIEILHAKRRATSEAKNSCRVKRRILRTKTDSSSSEEDAVELETSDSLDDVDWPPNNADSVEDETIRKGDFCLTKLAGKKAIHYYIAEVTDVENSILEGKDEQYVVTYLKKLQPNKFTYVEGKTFVIEKEDIIMKLPPPETVGGSARQCMQLSFGINFEQYNVE